MTGISTMETLQLHVIELKARLEDCAHFEGRAQTAEHERLHCVEKLKAAEKQAEKYRKLYFIEQWKLLKYWVLH